MKNKKSLAVFLTVCLLSILTLSNLYISENTFHKCHEKHCKVCSELRIVEALVREITNAFIPVYALCMILFFAHILQKFCFLFQRKNTLVLLKVRLDD